MYHKPFYQDDDYQETTPTLRGGCFSIILGPLLILFLLTISLRFLYGETTQPWEIKIVLVEFPASANEISNPGNLQLTPSLSQTGIAPIFAPSVQFWEDDILRWATESEIDPNLIATIMQIESCGDPRALSPAGAIGLFQVMPYHFSDNDSPYLPDTNALRGLAYLYQSLETHQDIRLALAGYNGGIGTAAKPENQWPQETIRYTYWGSGIYQDASLEVSTSERLTEWYKAGGAGLCKQAEQRLGISP